MKSLNKILIAVSSKVDILENRFFELEQDPTDR
jgi:hypothetical protein